MSSLTEALEDIQDRYRVEEVAARSDEVTVYRVAPQHGRRVVSAGHGPAIGDISYLDDNAHTGPVRVGETVFLGIVHRPIPKEGAPTNPWREAKRLIRQAARRIDPDVAGFPEWNRIYADDPYFLDEGIAADRHWGAFQITSYKRVIHQASQEWRASHQFSTRQRHLLLERAGHQCQRCGSTDSLEVDHIVPVSHGGTNEDENGLVLCKACHLEKTQAERKIIGLSGHYVEHNTTAARRAEVARITASPASLLAELERRTGFAIGPAQIDV
jgi:5-methylcytosine-specific restriction endonuclease McrA